MDYLYFDFTYCNISRAFEEYEIRNRHRAARIRPGGFSLRLQADVYTKKEFLHDFSRFGMGICLFVFIVLFVFCV